MMVDICDVICKRRIPSDVMFKDSYPSIINDSKERHWCPLFKEGQTNVHGEKHSGQPNVVTHELAGKSECKSL